MIRVYRYGLLPPTEQNAMVRDQMRLAHRYQNTLTEIERGRREAMRAAQSTVGDVPALEASYRQADAVLEAALKEVRKVRAAARARAESPAQKEAVKQARQVRSDAKRALYAARTAIRTDPILIATYAVIHERAAELRKSARTYCGLGKEGPYAGAWGTYLLVEAAAEQSAKQPLFDGIEANNPRFRTWVGEGRVGVQIQGGMPMAEVFAATLPSGADPGGEPAHSRLHITPVNADRAWIDRAPGVLRARGEGKRWFMRTTFKMRVGSTPEKAPIWASWPMMMHRPIPKGSVIKMAVVNLRKIGPREEWYVCLTVEVPDEAQVRAHGQGRAAVDFGWRLLEDGSVRVAMVVPEAGVRQEYTLPPRFFSALDKAESLQAIRQKLFNATRDATSMWIDLHTVPPWLKKSASHLFQWEACGRLYALAKRWADNRFEGDEEAYDALEAWRYKEHHLWEWESSQRMKTIRWRQNHYRNLAATLARTYETIVLGETDWRDLAKRPSDNATAQRNRQRCAVGEFEQAIRHACTSRKGTIQDVDAHDITHECADCGYLNGWDAADAIAQTCEKCHRTWDQDTNASRVLLKRAQTPPSAPTGTNSLEGSRWSRAKKRKKEKEASI